MFTLAQDKCQSCIISYLEAEVAECKHLEGSVDVDGAIKELSTPGKKV